MLVIDPKNGDIVHANPAAISYYGWSLEVLSAMKITDINLLKEKQVFQEMEKAKSKEGRHFIFQHSLFNGDIRDVEVYSGLIKLHGQKLLYSIIYDITERIRAEEALKRRMETDGNLDLVLGNVTKLEEGGIRLKAPLVAEFVLLFSFAFTLDFGLVLQFLFDLLDGLLALLDAVFIIISCSIVDDQKYVRTPIP